jgi:hypothetical protein
MSRPRGLGRTADVASDILTDDRVQDAVALVGSAAVVAYLAVVTGSWSRGERVALSSAVRRLPRVYDLGDLDELAATLARVGLLDADGRIPETTWASWYGPAKARADALAKLSPMGVAARRDRHGNRDGNRGGNTLPPTLPLIGGGGRIRGGVGETQQLGDIIRAAREHDA